MLNLQQCVGDKGRDTRPPSLIPLCPTRSGEPRLDPRRVHELIDIRQHRRVFTVTGRHGCLSFTSLLRGTTLLCALLAVLACKVHAQVPPAAAPATGTVAALQCLPGGNGFLRARLSGAVNTELVWGNRGLDCTGTVRPDNGGIRVRFAGPIGEAGQSLVLLFGISGLREGQSARTRAVNLTLIREGAGEFYSTQGDDKCMLDEVSQLPLVGIPHKSRSYRIAARGFCTEPARAVRGAGVILISRFDFAGRIDFDAEDATPEPQPATASVSH